MKPLAAVVLLLVIATAAQLSLMLTERGPAATPVHSDLTLFPPSMSPQGLSAIPLPLTGQSSSNLASVSPSPPTVSAYPPYFRSITPLVGSPPPALFPPAVSTQPSSSGAVVGTPCAPGCTDRGNCNSELGRCDCPPLISGEACDQNAVSSCRVQWGLQLPFAPCQACHAP